MKCMCGSGYVFHYSPEPTAHQDGEKNRRKLTSALASTRSHHLTGKYHALISPS